MSEFWTAFGQALLILAALALFVAWVICAMVGVAGAIRRPEGSRYARFWCRASWLTVAVLWVAAGCATLAALAVVTR